MLLMCRRDQWHADDLDWTVKPRTMTRSEEIAIVQYFTDMAGIERLAGALFEVQQHRAPSDVLRKIFASFVVDEERHSLVAQRLADHYNVHRYRVYQENPHLTRFAPYFHEVVSKIGPDIANSYITTGELLLDIALLRSLNDFVHDDMSEQAMKLINRDESRHIAIDYHMVDYYSSEEYLDWEQSQPGKTPRQVASTALTMTQFFFHAGPFLRDVFFAPMDLVDPGGDRLLEAFKRIQLLSAKPAVAARPFSKFISALQSIYLHPVLGPYLGPAAQRIMGLDARVIRVLFTEEEKERAIAMSFDELATEALSIKESAALH